MFCVCIFQQMLTDVPDYTERCQFLETLKNKLEVLIASEVINAFDNQALGVYNIPKYKGAFSYFPVTFY